ncbi:cytochrome P450 302a1, mitochondrial-like isoform X2 [Ornithodoros turicata]
MFRHEGDIPKRPVFEALAEYRRSRPNYYKDAGLSTDNNEAWQRLRQKVNWMMHQNAAEMFIKEQDLIAQDFVGTIKKRRDKHGEIKNFLDDIYRYTEEAIGWVCFGKRLGLLQQELERSKLHEFTMKYLDALAKTLLGFPWWKAFRTAAYRDIEATQDFFASYIQQELSKIEEQPNLFHQLTSKEPGTDRKDIGLLMTEIYIAGIDTTGNSIGFLLYHLARNLNVQEKLHQEVASYKDEPLTPEVLRTFRYLRACVKESYRLSPTSGGNARILAKDAILSGYRVPAGTLCIGINPVICQQEKFFADPMKFDPDRWTRSSDQKRNVAHPFCVLPFGHGLRRCVGQRFAEQEIQLAVAKIIQNFRVEYHHEDIGVVMKLLLHMDKPLTLTFKSR